MVWVVHTVLPATDTVGVGLTTKVEFALAVQPTAEVMVVEYTPAFVKPSAVIVLFKVDEEKMLGPDHTAPVPPLTLITALLPSHFGELLLINGTGDE
jgi:hypothetical protein